MPVGSSVGQGQALAIENRLWLLARGLAEA
jgi:hypothetical protein